MSPLSRANAEISFGICSMRVGPGNCTRAPHRTGREAACQTALGRSTFGDDHGGQDWSHTGQAAHMQRRKPCRRVNYQNDGHAKPSISSSRSTVEPIKFVSARFTEFLQRILNVTKGRAANLLRCHTGALVRVNNLIDRVRCGLNYFLRGVEANPVLQCVNGHQCTSFLHLAIQRFDLKTCGFINEFRIKRFALSKLFAEEITSILTALIGVGGNERGEGPYQ